MNNAYKGCVAYREETLFELETKKEMQRIALQTVIRTGWQYEYVPSRG